MNPYLTVHWIDEPTATKGYLVIDKLIDGVAAGGLRIQSQHHIRCRCRTRSQCDGFKQAAVRHWRGRVKAGLDLNPSASYREDVIRRFLMAIRPLILTCFSCGPDMNTTMSKLK